MLAKLEVLSGAKAAELTLRLPTVVGRGGDARLKLPASTVSRHHCELYGYEGQIVVRDLGSSNGTRVNGHKIMGPTFLTPSDELTVGPVTMRLTEYRGPDLPVSAEATADRNAAGVPDFEGLPPQRDSTPPVEAESQSPLAVPEAVDDDDSILQYAEPTDSGRSFLGIVAESRSTEGPIVDDDQAARSEPISPDESALTEFLKKLGE